MRNKENMFVQIVLAKILSRIKPMTRQQEVNVYKAVAIGLGLLCGLLAYFLWDTGKDCSSSLVEEVVLDTPTAWCSVSDEGINFRYIEKK